MAATSAKRPRRLTPRQVETLALFRDWKMPASFERDGWPGFPERTLDMRVVPGLVELGYVEGGVHQWGSGRETRGGPWWRITDAGRESLARLEARVGGMIDEKTKEST